MIVLAEKQAYAFDFRGVESGSGEACCTSFIVPCSAAGRRRHRAGSREEHQERLRRPLREVRDHRLADAVAVQHHGHARPAASGFMQRAPSTPAACATATVAVSGSKPSGDVRTVLEPDGSFFPGKKHCLGADGHSAEGPVR